LYSLSGKWDGKIDITNCKAKQPTVLWDSNGAKRIPKVVPPFDKQEEFESHKLWQHVTAAIKKRDQKEATVEKTRLEEAQRKERNERTDEWVPRLFRKSSKGEWIYRYINTLPYTPGEGDQEEQDGIIYFKEVGLQATVNAEERNFKAFADRDDGKKPAASSGSGRFSTGFLRGSGK